MDIKENAAYLKGLFEGYEIDASKKEGKIISGLLDMVSQLAEEVDALSAECAELRDYVEELDEDLGAIEEEFYFTDSDEEEEEYDEFEEAFMDDFDDDSGYDELECPACGEIICVDDSVNIEEISCPACGEKFGDIELCDGECESCDSNGDCE